METKLQFIGQKIAVAPGEALFLVGYSRSAETGYKTAANLMSRGEFPFTVRRFEIAGREKKLVLVSDIQAALLGQPQAPAQPQEVTSPPTSRGPGRPRKAVAGGQK
ncbi:MAG: hypothetical protein M0Z99_35350 [Betaproteobacteria bacterium]|nr:hypothetical protein [Betaproteobacteria bacterium]